MTSKTLLARWISLERGDGLQRVRKLIRCLSIGAFVLFMTVTLGVTIWEFPSWLLVTLAIPIGFLVAERNALDNRLAQWPILRKYIDWPHVHRDLESMES